MSTNKDLLKQAIAEAKTIREAAIANAKEALEETLTPHLKEMLAQKLQEMEMDEEDMDEYGMEHNDRDLDGDGKVTAKDTKLAEAEEEAPEEEEAEEEAGEEETEEEDVNIEDMSVEELKDLIRDIVAQETGHDEEAEMETGEEAPEGEEDMVSMDGDSEEIDINELLAELEGMDEYGVEHNDRDINGDGKIDAKDTKIAEVEEDLNEALKAVSILRKQLQEVNLLNAKLLYVNKVFKSNNLSEGQKVNVIAAFDKAETVKEVKLVFETVSKNVVTKPATIKEHRSFASKATGNAQTTAPKEILSEVSEQVQRWQKLAGIIKS